MRDYENELDHKRAERHAVAVAEAGASPDYTNLARAYLSLAARMEEAEGFLENLRPLARKAEFYRKLLVERCGEEFVRSEENEEDFLQALDLERLKEEYIRNLKAAKKKDT
jgi:hypothetical protein